ncbi:MAG: virulence RhuM family protein [Dysgonamonadaceae bacterium]|jgi:hypothetical protein|nr:virulence RhuM family protein [Dysgonamonadaceae bacterium]
MPTTCTYQLPDSNISLEVLLEDGSVWLTIDQMAMLYGRSRATVNEHILNIFKDGELLRENVTRKIGISDFSSGVSTKPTNYYNFDLILSLGYRIKSPQTAPFRVWATDRIAEVKELQMPIIQENSDIVFYSDPDGKLHVELTFDGDTFWTTQRKMGELFSVETHTINYHLTQIFESNELNRYSVIRKIRITAPDGKQYDTLFYNLDAIIAVGYRVNSVRATQFRTWATQVLSEFLRNGIAMDDERFKKGDKWSKEHFQMVLERIQEIRTSERLLYQKITDIYATADDYRKDALTTRHFYAKVQNKLHWAITGQTAAEIIYTHADASKLNMGLTSWKLAPHGKIMKSDVDIAKNYLSEEHIKELNQIVSAYLDLAENRAKRHITTTMEDWAMFLDSFLELSSYPILLDAGKITAEQAKIKAYEEYNKFRVIQDKRYESDFDKELRLLMEKQAEYQKTKREN